MVISIQEMKVKDEGDPPSLLKRHKMREGHWL
jgi:hypothetical protein